MPASTTVPTNSPIVSPGPVLVSSLDELWVDEVDDEPDVFDELGDEAGGGVLELLLELEVGDSLGPDLPEL